MKLIYNNLKLIPYEGTGNITPVLDVGSTIDINKYEPARVREFLEKNGDFRLWLKKESQKLNADSVMIYYRSKHIDYDFVTFVGEPNGSLNSSFSDMCGNGICCLSLHIGLNQSAANGTSIYIWAGSVKKTIINQIDNKNNSGKIEVDMNKFQCRKSVLQKFVNLKLFPNIETFSKISLPNLPDFLKEYKFGIGFNGVDIGEPQLVLLVNKNKYEKILNEVIPKKTENFMQNIRMITSSMGPIMTFDKNLFPQGINFNFGVIADDMIYMSTHERNILSSSDICRGQQKNNYICRCNTLSCGTGGAAAANIAFLQGLIEREDIITVHPGGEIKYILNKNTTIMLGSAKKIN